MKPILATLLAATTAFAAEPIIIADFEGSDYGAWTASGTAFGTAPARGSLAGQQAVTGFQGKGLVNTYLGGDDATGRLVSPKFRIERKFLTFLIGGGGYDGETCMNLIVDGKMVRTATGPNTEPGGSEQLAPTAWDLTEFAGREGHLEIVDARKGGWGHINVDQIVQTDDRGRIPLYVAETPRIERTRRLKIDADFLHLPLLQRTEGRRKGVERFTIEDGSGKVLRFVHLEFPSADQHPDFIYSYDVRALRGEEVTLKYKSADPRALERLEFGNTEHRPPYAYLGAHRPRFHFSPRLGWMNDINGSYYQDGLYHVFYQANPTTAASSTGFDMHWGHSVSRDLVHWEEWPIALFPDATGQCYSGTATLMRHVVPGLNDGAKLPTPALFVAATSPFSQHLTASTDGGRTWKRYAGNPVVKNMGDGDRDPKIVWHEPSQHYVMVLYVGGPDTYRFLRSKDLVAWEQTSSLPHWFECPEFFPVKSPTTGEDLWLLYGCYRNSDPAKGEVFQSNSCFQLGRFDGKTFTPVGKIRHAHQGPNFYGALVFVNAPNSRNIMMGWARGTRFPGEPFNQCASVPLEMKLRAINGEDILCYEPVAELEALREKALVDATNQSTSEIATKLESLSKDSSLDVSVQIHPSGNTPITVRVRGITFRYEPETKTLSRGDQKTRIHPGDSISIRLLIDRGVVEAFWNGGEAAYTIASLHTDQGPAVAIEGDAQVERLTIHSLRSIWE